MRWWNWYELSQVMSTVFFLSLSLFIYLNRTWNGVYSHRFHRETKVFEAYVKWSACWKSKPFLFTCSCVCARFFFSLSFSLLKCPCKMAKLIYDVRVCLCFVSMPVFICGRKAHAMFAVCWFLAPRAASACEQFKWTTTTTAAISWW